MITQYISYCSCLDILWNGIAVVSSCILCWGKKTFSFFSQTSSFKCQDHEGSLLCHKLETEVFHDTFQDWASSKHCIFFLIENDCEAWNRKLKQLSIQQTIYILHSLRHIYRWDKRFLVANVDFWNHQNKHALPQKGLAPILIAPPHTYIQQRLVLWNKTKPMLLTYREETKQPQNAAGLPAPWVLSSFFLPYRNTVSTPDASGTAWQNTIELIIISDAVYTGYRATTRQIPDSKLLPRSIYDILTQISNDFQWSLCTVQCQGWVKG